MTRKKEDKYTELKPYKGYPIAKCEEYDDLNRKTTYYVVTDIEDGLDFEEDLWTLKEAKTFIDSMINFQHRN